MCLIIIASNPFAGAILLQKNIDIQTIDLYKNLEEELQKYSLSMKSPRKLVSVLLRINQLGYDTLRTVKELAQIKSLKQLKKDCKILESRVARYKQLLPLCDQITRLGIGFHELMAFHGAVMKKADLEKTSYSKAAYSLMDGIDTYEGSKSLVDIRDHHC